MPATATTLERITGKLSDQPLLFQYTIKLVLLVAFLELILYRLVSRLGMHLSKLAADHQWIIPTFTALTEVGQRLLNVVAILFRLTAFFVEPFCFAAERERGEEADQQEETGLAQVSQVELTPREAGSWRETTPLAALAGMDACSGR